MATVYYPAIVERAGDGYSVFFPDLPGCTSAGGSMQEAAVNAEEALAAHLILSAEHGDQVAEPSAFDAIERDDDVDEAARVLVRADMPGRAIRLNVTLDEGLVAAIDRVAPNRSGFLADAARVALGTMARSGFAGGQAIVYATRAEAVSGAHKIARGANTGRFGTAKASSRKAAAKDAG